MSKYLLLINTDDGNAYKVNANTPLNGHEYANSSGAISLIESLICRNQDKHLLRIAYKDLNTTFFINPSKIVVIESKDLFD